MTRKNSTAAVLTMFVGVGMVSFILVGLSAAAESLTAHVLIGAGAFVLLFFVFNVADIILELS